MKFPQLSSRKFLKILYKFGFIKIRQKGSHVFLKHKDGRTTIIPDHPNKKINKQLLKKIVKKDLKLSKKEFIDMYNVLFII